jgi:hypothetical protein
MSLAARASGLQSLLRAAADQERLALDLGRMLDMVSVLEESAVELEACRVAAEELRSAGAPVATPLFLNKVEDVAIALERSREQLAAAPLHAAQDEFQRVVQRTRSLARDMSSSLSEAWQQYRDGLPRPPVDEDFLRLLERAGVDVGRVSEAVESALARLFLLSTRTLPRSGDVAALDKALADLAWAMEEVGRLVPGEVRDFVVQASSAAGAGLDLLTDAVLEYLRAAGLATRYRIRQGR